MQSEIFKTKEEAGAAAADRAADGIRRALEERGRANLILATGASQFEMLEALTRAPGIEWRRVTLFHLDEYIGVDEAHPASFRRYLRERFIDRVGTLAAAHLIDGGAGDPEELCRKMSALIERHPIDVACAGIGENGHLAFNDPPADFETGAPYIVVNLDLKCREQQLGEGWFATLDDVPRRAVSMSVRQIMKSARLVVTVPDLRKAEAVRRTLQDPVSPEIPASILRSHGDCRLYLDEAAASLL
jgi:glucosamine-6-phosphate deaminase